MSDEKAIKNCVESYYESLYTSDAEGVREVFHENAMIAGYLPDGLVQMTVDQFAEFVGAQQPSPSASNAPKMLEIVSCEYAGATAAVLLRESYLGMDFFDTFSLLKVDDRWKIYNKLFHVEE